MSALFLTGFPGFLGSELVKRLLQRHPTEVPVICLIQQKFRQQALQHLEELDQLHEGWSQRIWLVEGDITEPDLGLSETQWETLRRETMEVYHLAAVYALGVRRDVAMRVNVDGTRNMLRFAQQCHQLRRFHYVSTCYVSGRYGGEFKETDLKKGQKFQNYYEETKYWAEMEVQQCQRKGLPVTIYRPAIVVGNSQTGLTQKYDGPYYAIQWILRQPRYALMFLVGDTTRSEVNVVPSDFVVNAIDYLSAQEKSLGQVYQLSDPQPLTVDKMLDAIATATKRHIWRMKLPDWLVKGSLRHVPGVYSLVRIEPEAIDYFTLPTRYSCDNTLRDLAGSGIYCPPFVDYVSVLVQFMAAHPEISAEAMV